MTRRAIATAIITVLVYGALLYSVLTESTYWIRAFGPSSFGLATPVTAALIVSLLYLPAPWIAWHAMEIVLRGQDIGMPIGKLGIFYTVFTIGSRIPELRRSQSIAIGGFFYFIAIIAAWIYYAHSHGL